MWGLLLGFLRGVDHHGQDLEQIADNAVRYVKPGGVLMYSTCTVHKAENEKMASYILKNGGFTLVSSKQLLPDTEGTDGFYYAVFIK